MATKEVTRAPGTDTRREPPGGRSGGGIRPTPTGRRSAVPGPRPPIPWSRAFRSRVSLAGLCAASCDRPLVRPLFFVTRSSFHRQRSPRLSHTGPLVPRDLLSPLGPGSHRCPWFPFLSQQTCWPHLSPLPRNNLPFDLDSPDGTASFLHPCCPQVIALRSLLAASSLPHLPHDWSPALRNH